MARTWTLAAILLGCGCSDKPAPEPKPVPALPSLRIQLRPTSYGHVAWQPHWWRLREGQDPFVDPGDIVDTNQPHRGQQFGRNWFALTCDNTLRFHFCERGEFLCIYRPGFGNLFALIPLTLTPGITWDSPIRDEKGASLRKACCILDGDLFRVDFSEAGKAVHTMWFSPADGLIRWDGIENTPVLRREDPLKYAAQTYTIWRRVDDEIRLAPGLCRGPIEPALRTSTSRDEATHGRKQYYLFASDRAAYLHARDVDQPDGQIVIKESFFQKTKGPLFMMMKSDGEWTYATASPDGKTITAQGKLTSCMECHESDRTRDRMFGLQSCASSK